jgi:hypothetical protein
MAEMDRPGEARRSGGDAAPIPAPGPDRPPAWEEVERGRYRPRRIRGSYPGRELG